MEAEVDLLLQILPMAAMLLTKMEPQLLKVETAETAETLLKEMEIQGQHLVVVVVVLYALVLKLEMVEMAEMVELKLLMEHRQI